MESSRSLSPVMPTESRARKLGIMADVKAFGQETTWHGVKQVTETGPAGRQISWAAVVLLSVGLFSYTIGSKLMEYYEYNSQIELRTSYEKSLPFPRVTVCNLSPYKMTRVFGLGLHDTIVDAIKASTTKVESADRSQCLEYYELDKTLCDIPENVSFSFTFRDITSKVCSQICSHQEPIRCSGYFYDKKSRTCVLTSAMGNTGQICQNPNNTKYYAKRRCVEKPDISCDFEGGSLLNEGQCTMNSSFDMNVMTLHATDHTIGTDKGHYLALLESSRREGSGTRIETPFTMLSDTCVQFFYKVNGLVDLRLLLRGQDGSEKELGQPLTGDNTDWKSAFVHIPHSGIYQVIIEAKWQLHVPVLDSVYSSVFIDDLRIMQCTAFHDINCRLTPSGDEYLGIMDSTTSDATCKRWSETLPWLGPNYHFQNTDDINSNYCRTPTAVTRPPWCYVDDFGAMELCNVPMCSCRQGWFSCWVDERCIPSEFVCDGDADCVDGSDEAAPCVDQESQECSFEKGFMCGYKVTGIPSIKWARTETYLNVGNGDMYSLHLQYHMAIPGSRTYLLSPFHTFVTRSAITFYSDIKTDAKFSVEIVKDDSAIKSPVLIQVDKSVHLFCVPEGTYNIRFIAEFRSSPRPDIILDNIRHLRLEEVLYFKTVEQHCKGHWPDIRSRIVYSDFKCSFEETNCDVSQRFSSHDKFEWQRVPHHLVTSGRPPPRQDECDTTYTSPSGVIKSPNYPAPYEHNTDCFITIEQQYAELILVFTDFDVEYSSNCRYDYVKIYESSNASNIVKTLCGSDIPHRISTFYFNTTIHFHSDSSVTKKGYSLNYTIVTDEIDQAFSLLYTGLIPGIELMNSLLLPNMQFGSERCLSLTLHVVHPIIIYRIADGNRTRLPLLTIDIQTDEITKALNDSWFNIKDGLGPAWHIINFNLSPNRNHTTQVEIDTHILRSSREYSTAIKNMQLEEGRCEDVFDNGSVSCNFTDSDQCGYIDVSESEHRWLRRYNKHRREYRLFTTIVSILQPSPTLLTPTITLTSPNCLLISISCFGQEASLSVSRRNSSSREVTPLWTFNSQSICVGFLKSVQVDLAVGQFRLLIAASGDSAYMSIAQVDVKEGACLPFSEYSFDAPQHYHSQALQSAELHQEENTRQQHRKEAQVDILQDLIDDENGRSMRAFVEEASHSLNDTIISCTWNGEPCPPSMVRDEITDLGKCFVINYDSINILHTTVPGALNGLRLLLNAEGYEQMDNIAFDRGMKVLLDHQDETQLTKIGGFGTAPGTYSLASIHYSEGQFLQPEWGSCGAVDLPYYSNDTYTYSRCKHACLVTTLMDKCQCGDVYMQGQTQVCDMKVYLECVLPVLSNGSGITDGLCQDCRGACSSYSYEPALSSAMLSAQIISKLSEDQRNHLADSVNLATRLKPRVTPESMMKLLQYLTEVRLSLVDLESYSAFMLFDSSSSVFSRIETAVNDFHSSLDKPFKTMRVLGEISLYEYNKYLSTSVEAIVAAWAEVQQCRESTVASMKAVINYDTSDVLAFWKTVGFRLYYDFEKYVMALYRRSQLIERGSPLKDLFEVNILEPYIVLPQSLITLKSDDDRCQMLRKNPVSNSTTVDELYEQLYAFVSNVHSRNNGTQHTALHRFQIDNEQDVEYFLRLVHAISAFFAGLDGSEYITTDELIQCMRNYSGFLEQTEKRWSSLNRLPLAYSTKLSSSKTLAKLRTTIYSVEQLYRQFSLNEIGVIELSERSNEEKARIDNVLSDLNSILEQQLLTPMLAALEKLEASITTDVLRYLDDSIAFADFLPSLKEHLKIVIQDVILWRLPRIRLHGKELIQTELGLKAGSDVFEIPLKVFRHTLAPGLISKSLQGFFSSASVGLQDALNHFLAKINAAEEATLQLSNVLEVFQGVNIASNEFVQDNILQLDIYYSDMGKTEVIQKKAYDLLAFFGDVGGYMGLLLGASVISVVEILDWVIFQCLMNRRASPVARQSSAIKRTPIGSLWSVENQTGVNSSSNNGNALGEIDTSNTTHL